MLSPREQVQRSVGCPVDVRDPGERVAQPESGSVDQDVATLRREQRLDRVPGVAVDEHGRPQHGGRSVADDPDVEGSEPGGDPVCGGGQAAAAHGVPRSFVRVFVLV